MFKVLSKCSLLTMGLATIQAHSETFTFRTPETKGDPRYEYDNAVLKLALEKTKGSHGPYEFKPSAQMNFSRSEKALEQNLHPNFFLKQSYSQDWAKKLVYVPFPIDLGIVGYRVCFLPKSLKGEFAKVSSIADMKKYVHGQGSGWGDVAILRAAGFKVVERPKYETLFKLVASRRGFDIFCRGANELAGELKAFGKIKNLAYDEAVSLAYPLPRFFFTSRITKRQLIESLKV